MGESWHGRPQNDEAPEARRVGSLSAADHDNGGRCPPQDVYGSCAVSPWVWVVIVAAALAIAVVVVVFIARRWAKQEAPPYWEE